MSRGCRKQTSHFEIHEETTSVLNLLFLAPLPLCSRSGARAIEELQRTLVEIEGRYKAEMNKLKKKYEVEIREYELQVDTLGRSNAELLKSNKALGNKCKVRRI